MDTERKEGILLSLLASFCAGCTPIFSKVILEYYSPSMTLFIRMVVSMFLLYFIVRYIGRVKLIFNKETIRIAFFGSLNFLFFIFAIKYMPAHIAPIFYCLVPIEVSLLSFVMYREKVSVIQLLGIFVGYLGAIVVVLPSFSGKEHEEIQVLGIVLIVLASMSIALYNLLVQTSNSKYSPYNLSFQSILLATVISVGMLFAKGGTEMGIPFKPIVILYFLGIALLGTIGQYVIMQLGIAKIKASANVVFFYFQPFFVLVMSVVFLGEKVKATYFVGLAIVLVGSSLNLFTHKPKSEEIIEMS